MMSHTCMRHSCVCICVFIRIMNFTVFMHGRRVECRCESRNQNTKSVKKKKFLNINVFCFRFVVSRNVDLLSGSSLSTHSNLLIFCRQIHTTHAKMYAIALPDDCFNVFVWHFVCVLFHNR